MLYKLSDIIARKALSLLKEYKQKHIVLLQIMHAHMSASRIAHCERVSQLCLQFVLRLYFRQCCNTEDAFLGGISHDICRECEVEKLYTMVKSSSMGVTSREKQQPILLHAKAGILFLKQHYPLSDDVYAAIKTHVLGNGMKSILQKIVYISDALDDRRKIWDSTEGKKTRQEFFLLTDIDQILQRLTFFLDSYYE